MKKIRIVVIPEDYIYTTSDGRQLPSVRFVEVYFSTYKVDCINWIKRQLKSNPDTWYQIFVKEDWNRKG